MAERPSVPVVVLWVIVVTVLMFLGMVFLQPVFDALFS
jgi:hypothetical protein